MPRHTPIYAPLDRSGRSAQRISHAGASGRPVRILRWMAFLVLLALLLLGIQNAYPSLAGSDIFRLEEITVVGNRLLSSHQVVAQSGLETGGNLFEADLAAATGQLISHPVIKGAFLVRQPPETLVISVEERRPIVLVLTPEGLLGMDCGGTLFPLPQVALDLPVVTGIQRLALDAGDARFVPLVDFAETLCARAPTFWRDVSEVRIESSEEASVYTVGDGLRLRMCLKDADVQAQNFGAYLETRECQTASPAYVDLRFTNQVVVGRR